MTWVECILLGFIASVVYNIKWGAYGLLKQFSSLKEEFRLTRGDYQHRFAHQDAILTSITTHRELFKGSLDVITRNLILIQGELFELKMQADRRDKPKTSEVRAKGKGKKGKKGNPRGHVISESQRKAISEAVKRKWDSYSMEEREARKAQMWKGRKKKAARKEQPKAEVIELPQIPAHSTI